MIEFILGVIVGAVVMDFLWAYKMGIITLVWSDITQKYNKIFRKYH